MKGTIKWYNSMKGFGFISGDDGKEVFVHRTVVPEGLLLYEGDKVEYQVKETDRGPNAIDIKKLKNA